MSEPNATARSASANGRASAGHGFGTAPVFLASISTILGAVLFLRFGYAVAHAGVLGTLLIVVLGHAVTLPTALAIAEIATNRRVEGGGEYFIISRSFGITIGAAIGVSLYLSQAVSVAFYMIAFAEAFRPLAPWFQSATSLGFDPRLVSLPGTLLLAGLVIARGADVGVKALWLVVAALAASLLLFFLGGAPDGVEVAGINLTETVADPDPFMLVFAIVFPAFTGMTAGVGLSGDLANPRRSLPLGILSATVVGMAVYVALVFKLAGSATPEMLAGDQLIMARIALWPPIIPIGLACATISSALGSLLVAPRTLQALAADGVAPSAAVNSALRHGEGSANEPRNATLVTVAIALVFVAAGSVDFVARIISMFFMVTYGALCSVSFLEHFAARPSYRPSFRSQWYLSLPGALMCLFLMFQMDPLYALAALLVMIALYRAIERARGAGDLSAIFHGVMTQMTRQFQIRLQQAGRLRSSGEWRPSIVMVDARTFSRSAPLHFLGWLCHRFGFGTYLHYIQGQLDPEHFKASRRELARLISLTHSRGSGVYVDTIVSPSIQSALAQSLQIPGVSGMENNTALFGFSTHDEPEALQQVYDGCQLATAARMNSLVLRHGDHFFGNRAEIHIWLTWHDYKNANLMILLAYILLGHKDWEDAEIRIFAAFPQGEVSEQRRRLKEMIDAGRLPMTEKSLRIIGTDDQVDFNKLVEQRSAAADLVVCGFTDERMREKGPEHFLRHAALRDVLWVQAQQQLLIE